MKNIITGFKHCAGGIFMVLILNFLIASSAFAQFGETVRIGVFNLGNFMRLDNDNTPHGYNIDYLNRIAEETNWQYQYVPCKNWADAVRLLDDGAIDMLAPAQQTPLYLKKYKFPIYRMGLEFTAIYTLKERNDLLYDDFKTMAGLSFGGVKNSSFSRKFVNYAQKNGFTPKLVDKYQNTTELFEGLRNHEVDAVAANLLFMTDDNLKILSRFTPEASYFMTRPDKEYLLKELDNAVSSINGKDINFVPELIHNHLPQYSITEISFAEQQYIAELPEVRVGMLDDCRPLSYQENGEMMGIQREILDKIAAECGLKFKYVRLTFKQLREAALEDLDVDVIAGMRNNQDIAKQGRVLMTHEYLPTDAVFVALKPISITNESNLKIAILDSAETYKTVIKQEYPASTLISCSSPEQCFEAVTNGEADVLLLNSYSVDINRTKPQYREMTVIPMPGLVNGFSMAIMAENRMGQQSLFSDSRFISAVNKAINNLSADDISFIVTNMINKNMYNYGIKDVLKQYSVHIGLVMFIVIVLFIAINRMRSMEARRARELGAMNEELGRVNEQLRTAMEQADKASAAKSLFLSRVSHEIRTPMNAIVGITTIAKAHLQEAAKISECLDKIHVASRVLLNIINDVLDMSAIENAKMRIAHEEFNLRELLSSVSVMYYTQCRNKGLKFQMETSRVVNEFLVGDALRLNQIILNLISNAYKFTDAGGKISIKVEQTVRSDSEVFMRISVQDTGIGMSEEMQGRLFKSFEQEDAVTAQKYGGSGLGMAITANIVELMHGAINVKSRKGEGTTFTVDLPFEVSKKHQSMEKTKSFKNIRALIVDDDKNTIEYTSIILDRLGLKYEVAYSGEEAVEILNKAYNAGGGYDVCFVDMKMEGLNGLDVTRKIRELYADKTMVIIVSAYDLSEVMAEAEAAGANMYVSKPLFQSTVFDVLMNLSDGRLVNTTANEEEFDFHGQRVLLAEDNLLNKEIAVELLKMVNMEADWAADGKLAVEAFTDAPPGTYKAVLMDIQMPNLNGYDAARAIRALERPDAKTIPIIAMTANAFTEDVANSMAAGMNEHIAKPIDSQLLYSTLRKYIDEYI